jgi:molybdate transport system substrate-binding protein
MEEAIAAGRVSRGAEREFARNRLVVVTPRDNPASIAGLQDLARPGVKLVLAAHQVPAGAYSLDFLARAAASPWFTAAFSPTVLANVVSYEQSVKAVLSKVALGEADAGIVYASDASSADVARIEIPDGLNPVASYPLAPIANAANPALARRFVDYVLSPAGQAILASHGFTTERILP